MPRDHDSKLVLTELCDRIVPAAHVNLTTAGASAGVGGGIVRQIDAMPAEDLRTFLQLHDCGSEQGYNTTARRTQFDERGPSRAARALPLGDVPVVVEGGVAYREFVLEVSERRGAARISLDEARVYVGETSNLTGYNHRTKTLAGMGAVYDLDGTGNTSVKLNANLNRGRGKGDMVLLVPDAAFAGKTADDFVYLYSKFGSTGGGFEEWAVRREAAPPPPPVEPSISGRVWLDINRDGVQDAGEGGIVGATITLQGTDDQGNEVFLTTQTAEDGTYTFANLRPGTYMLTQEQLPGLEDGPDFAGSAGGFVDNDLIGGIVLGAGVTAVGYDFSEYEQIGGGS
jgi:hypothetical protein